MKKIYLLLVLLLMTEAKINAAEPTIVQYKSSNRCYINISEALTDEQVATLKTEINSKGYTSVDFGTKNDYALTPTDLQKIFGKNDGLLQTTNDIKVLSLKDVTLTEEAANQYGQQIGYLPALEELTTPKSCKGPNMNSPSPEHKTIKKLIIPKLGANDTSDKALATVGQWQGYMALESIDLNTSIAPSGIEDNAFYRCSNLKTVKIMSTNITSIGENAFRDCVSMEKITLPYGLKTIGTAAFRNCFLKNINLPQTVETIGADAFRGNPNVRTIKIPASVQSIGSYAFGEMPELDNVYVFGENTKAAANAFDKDCVGERFTYTRSTLTERQQVQNATLEEANHTGWLRSDYKKLSSWTVNPSDGSVTLQYTTAPRNPAQLHILNTETAKKNYLNPFLRFLNGGYQVGDSLWTVEKLINVYKFIAEHAGETPSTAGWNTMKQYIQNNNDTQVATCDNVWNNIISYDTNNDEVITKDEMKKVIWTNANLNTYDYDSDSTITKTSVGDHYWDEIDQYDYNLDGTISKAEFADSIVTKVLTAFTTYFQDDDQVTKAELGEPVWSQISSYDTDNDGSINKSSEGDKLWNATPLNDLAKDSNNDITEESLGEEAWGNATDATNGSLKDYSDYTGDGKLTKSEVDDKAWKDLEATLGLVTGYTSGTITKTAVVDSVWTAATDLKAYDTNNDGTVTKTEIGNAEWTNKMPTLGSYYSNYGWSDQMTKENVTDKFWGNISKYDYDSDNTITKTDVADYAWNTNLSEKSYPISIYDYDSDDKVTRTQICDSISAIITKYDTDNSGSVTQAEVAAKSGANEFSKYNYDGDENTALTLNDAEKYLETLYNACKFSGMENEMKSYLKAIYFDGESDYKGTYSGNKRPWVTFYDSESSDNIVTRLPYYAWENQFPAPVSDPVNYATAGDQSTAKYAGWNQFILAFADAQTDQPETHIERWTGSKWYTICVPFSLSQHQVQETFGTQTEVVEFTKVIKDENGVTTFYFYKPAAELDESGSGGENNNTNYIKPYHPYMIHPGLTTAQVGMGGEHSEYRVILGELNTSGAGSPKDSWTQAQKAEKAITVNFYDYYEADNYDNTETDGKTATRYTFYGMAEEGKAYKPNSVDPYSGYTEMSTIPVGSFFWAYTKSNGQETNDGSFYHNAGQAIAWPQYTAIIYLSKGTDYMDYNVSSNARNGGTIFDLEDAEYIYDYDVDTGVLKVSLPAQPKAADNRVYNLNGQYVGDSLDGLTKGIYIMNGKKYVVK